MTWEDAFLLAALIAQLAAIFTVGAFIADYVVPKITRCLESRKWNAPRQ